MNVATVYGELGPDIDITVIGRGALFSKFSHDSLGFRVMHDENTKQAISRTDIRFMGCSLP